MITSTLENSLAASYKVTHTLTMCVHACVCVCVCVRAQSCLILDDPMDCGLPGSSVLGIFPGKNTAMDCHFLLQGIFPTQGSNPSLLRLLPWQADSFTTVPPRKLGLLP